MPKCFRGSFANKTQNSSKNSKQFWTLRLGRGSYEQLVSNSERFRDIQHSMSTVLDPGFHIWFIMALYYKMRQMLSQNATTILLQNASGFLLQNASRFLLQNATVLLQNGTVITNCDEFITKCDSYYNMLRLLQTATVHTSTIDKMLKELRDCQGWKKCQGASSLVSLSKKATWKL